MNNHSKMSDFNITAPIFWDQHEVANSAFQKVQLLHIMTKYLIAAYNKFLCCTSFFKREEYIQELIITIHLCYCQEVFCISLENLVLEKWLIEYTLIRKFHKYFSI